MLKEKEAVLRKAMILFDAFMVLLAFFLAYFLRKHFHTFYKLDLVHSIKVVGDTFGSISEYLVVLFFVVPFLCGILYLNGMYRSMRTRRLSEVMWIIIKSSFFSILAFGTVVFLFKLKYVSRMFFAIFVVISLTSIMLEKIAVFSIMHYVRKQGYNYRRLLIVGTGRRAASFINKIQNHPEWGFRILGAIDDEPDRGVEEVKDVKVIGTLNHLSKVLHRHAIDEVIFVIPRLRLNHIENAVYECETEGVRVTIAVDLFDLKIARSHQKELDGIPLLTFETTVANEWQLFVKRSMDIVISGLGLIILSPLFLVVAVLIKLTSKGPIFYEWNVIGLNKRRFKSWKFRTMNPNADEIKEILLEKNEMKGPVFKIKKDPRITKVGQFLRKFSLDELPQLWSVLKGDMSIVGPRPPLQSEIIKFDSWHRRKLSMKPGITCLWQVKGRNLINNFDDWAKLDLYYIDNWNIWMDLKLLFLTVFAVFRGSGR